MEGVNNQNSIERFFKQAGFSS